SCESDNRVSMASRTRVPMSLPVAWAWARRRSSVAGGRLIVIVMMVSRCNEIFFYFLVCTQDTTHRPARGENPKPLCGHPSTFISPGSRQHDLIPFRVFQDRHHAPRL